jgi:hypothetical protein
LSPVAARSKDAGFLTEEMRTRLAREPVCFDLQVQIAGSSDSTTDPSAPWASAQTIAVGTLQITDSDSDQESSGYIVVFEPMRVTDGIEPSEESDRALPQLGVHGVGAGPHRGEPRSRGAAVRSVVHRLGDRAVQRPPVSFRDSGSQLVAGASVVVVINDGQRTAVNSPPMRPEACCDGNLDQRVGSAGVATLA